MKNLKVKKLVPYALAATLMLTGCGKKSECDIPTRHVHEYVKNVTNDISIEKFLDNETMEYDGYHWTDNTIEITRKDEEIYHLLGKKRLFLGENNWEYLYYVMSNNHDYLKFYYEYDTIETYQTTDSEGNTHTETRTVHHDGWHTNPRDSDNTGKTRLYHHRYYGYKIVNENGKWKLERSQAVDDIRDVLFDYPYVGEDCVTEVYESFKFNKRDLPSLKPEDFDTFQGPNLDEKSLSYTKK